MKQIMNIACLAIIGFTVSLWAVAGGETLLNDKEKLLEKAVRRTMMYSGGPSGEWIRSIIKDNNIPKDAYFVTLEKIAEEFIADTLVYTNYLGKPAVGFRRGLAVPTLINAIGSLGDPEFLPWLERLATEPEGFGIRTSAAEAYVKIAGVDAVPFVRKILSGTDDKYDIGCKRLVLKEFFGKISQSETAKDSQEKINAAYVMLIKQAQSIIYVGHADQIDRFLCEKLEGYRSSVQREKVIECFVNSENEIARTNFRKKQEELQKTPKAERIDLSKCFPSLMEMKAENETQTQETTSAEGE